MTEKRKLKSVYHPKSRTFLYTFQELRRNQHRMVKNEGRGRCCCSEECPKYQYQRHAKKNIKYQISNIGQVRSGQLNIKFVGNIYSSVVYRSPRRRIHFILGKTSRYETLRGRASVRTCPTRRSMVITSTAKRTGSVRSTPSTTRSTPSRTTSTGSTVTAPSSIFWFKVETVTGYSAGWGWGLGILRWIWCWSRHGTVKGEFAKFEARGS